jgi:two-component system nitrate/nitrite response regulator NarL
VEQCRVVLADDDPGFRDLLGTFMRRDGRFSIIGEAGDGVEAVSLAVDRQPDVVVLDLNMPQLHGTEALARIREACSDVRIVVVSAVLGAHSAEVLMGQGADACLSKATPARSIVAAVADLVSV